MSKTNFDRYLGEQLKDPAFADRFQQALDALKVRVVFEPEGTVSGKNTVRATASRRAVSRKQKRD